MLDTLAEEHNLSSSELVLNFIIFNRYNVNVSASLS